MKLNDSCITNRGEPVYAKMTWRIIHCRQRH